MLHIPSADNRNIYFYCRYCRDPEPPKHQLARLSEMHTRWTSVPLDHCWPSIELPCRDGASTLCTLLLCWRASQGRSGPQLQSNGAGCPPSRLRPHPLLHVPGAIINDGGPQPAVCWLLCKLLSSICTESSPTGLPTAVVPQAVLFVCFMLIVRGESLQINTHCHVRAVRWCSCGPRPEWRRTVWLQCWRLVAGAKSYMHSSGFCLNGAISVLWDCHIY